MKINIKKCSWCKEGHDNIEMSKMKSPLYDGGEVYTHYAICPKTNYMILILKEDSVASKEKEEKNEQLEK